MLPLMRKDLLDVGRLQFVELAKPLAHRTSARKRAWLLIANDLIGLDGKGINVQHEFLYG
jgi:hypothetical protein